MKACKYLVALLLVGSLPLNAEETVDDAEKLLEVMGIQKQMLGGAAALQPMIDQMALQLKLDQEGKDDLTNVYQAWVSEDIDRALITREFAEVYRQTFTPEELAKLLTFFSSPIGKKLLSTYPQILKHGSVLTMEEAKRKHPQLMERLKQFVAKRGPKKPTSKAVATPVSTAPPVKSEAFEPED